MLTPLSRILIAAAVLCAAFLGALHSFAAPTLTARTSDDAGVRVVVTPKVYEPSAAVWEFSVVMDTHVKPLSENLTQAAILVGGAGRRYQPIAWQGDAPGGHHRKGVLQFSRPAETTKSIELQLAGVGGVAIRTFRWEVE
jgi:hypothetical protein